MPVTGRLALVGLFAIQAAIGYEWLISGLTKIVRGGFPAGLADELREKSEATAGWYHGFIDGTLIPNARAIGYLTEIGELLIGVALLTGAIGLVLAADRLPRRGQVALLWATAAAAFVGLFMNVNFHLANGSAHPWLIPADGFDEGVDLDSLMPFIQVVLILVSVGLLRALRRRPAGDAKRPAPRLQGAPTGPDTRSPDSPSG